MKTLVEAKYKYMYQDDRATRRTHIFEYWEAVEQEKIEIDGFVSSLSKNKEDKWLQEYMKMYYQTPALDGQLNVDYMIARGERLYTWEEMERSWKSKK